MSARHAGRAGQRERRDARAGLGEQPVGVAVVVPGELHEQVAAGGAAREADGASSSPRCRSRRAAASRPGADALPRRARRARSRPGSTRRTTRPRARHPAPPRRRRGCAWPRIAGPHEPTRSTYSRPSTSVTYGARRRDEEARRAADRAEGAHRRVHAAGDRGVGAGEELVVAWRSCQVSRAQPAGELDGPVGEHGVGAGATDADAPTRSIGALAVDPAVGGGGLDHRVLAGHLVGPDRHVGSPRRRRRARRGSCIAGFTMTMSAPSSMSSIDLAQRPRGGSPGRAGTCGGRPRAATARPRGTGRRTPRRTSPRRRGSAVSVWPGVVERVAHRGDLAVHHAARGRAAASRRRPARAPSSR